MLAWTFTFWAGILSLIVGGVKRKTQWGKRLALFGVVATAASLFFVGPELLDGIVEAYREGREAARD